MILSTWNNLARLTREIDPNFRALFQERARVGGVRKNTICDRTPVIKGKPRGANIKPYRRIDPQQTSDIVPKVRNRHAPKNRVTVSTMLPIGIKQRDIKTLPAVITKFRRNPWHQLIHSVVIAMRKRHHPDCRRDPALSRG
jgi:hypothetical protein